MDPIWPQGMENPWMLQDCLPALHFQHSMITDTFVKHQCTWKKPDALLFTRSVFFNLPSHSICSCSFSSADWSSDTSFEGQLLQALLHKLTKFQCFAFTLLTNVRFYRKSKEQTQAQNEILCSFLVLVSFYLWYYLIHHHSHRAYNHHNHQPYSPLSSTPPSHVT